MFSIRLYILLIIFIFVIPDYLPAVEVQKKTNALVIGQAIKINSKILNEERPIWVYLPEDYKTSRDKKYPVIYMLDGAFHFHHITGAVQILAKRERIPQMIVIAIPYIDYDRRDRDLSPTSVNDRPPVAGADNFLAFLKEELIPFIEKNYRTNDFKILYGHSVGGLFTMYALFNYPDLFTAYIAGSPWFQTNNQYWLINIEKMAKERDLTDKFLFMTVGKEEAQFTIDTYKELEKWMNSQSFDGLTWKSAWLEGDHGSMVGRNIYDGLTFIFSGWKIPATLVRTRDVDAIDDYVKTNKAKWGKYGFEKSLIIPEQRLNSWGYALIRMKELDKAIQLFEYTVKLHPKSFNALDSLAEGYLTKGDKENAIEELALFSQEKNYHYWLVLFLKMDPLIDNIKDLPEFKRILNEIEVKFWRYHDQIRASLDKKELL